MFSCCISSIDTSRNFHLSSGRQLVHQSTKQQVHLISKIIYNTLPTCLLQGTLPGGEKEKPFTFCTYICLCCRYIRKIATSINLSFHFPSMRTSSQSNTHPSYPRLTPPYQTELLLDMRTMANNISPQWLSIILIFITVILTEQTSSSSSTTTTTSTINSSTNNNIMSTTNINPQSCTNPTKLDFLNDLRAKYPHQPV